MDVVDTPENGRLRGCAILLSASVPAAERAEIYRKIEAADAIYEAVLSLARAVFSEGGTLVFGGHPTISPLVAQVVHEYMTPRVAERSPGQKKHDGAGSGPRVEIYQSEVYRALIAESTKRLERWPGVGIHWVLSEPGEFVDPAVHDRPKVPKSLRRMRVEMVGRRDLVGMVCIGGMEGVEEEALLFHETRPKLPVYVLESTGGAASLMAEKAANRGWIRVPDRGVREQVERDSQNLRKSNEGEKERAYKQDEREKGPRPEESFAFPYSDVAQKIVSEIVRSR